MNPNWQPGGPLNEVWSHLHCAVVQSLPSDDQIIMDHVRAAYKIMGDEMDKAVKEETMLKSEDTSAEDRVIDAFLELCRATEPFHREHAGLKFSGLKVAMDNARLQAAGVADPVTHEELRESIDVAERVAGGKT